MIDLLIFLEDIERDLELGDKRRALIDVRAVIDTLSSRDSCPVCGTPKDAGKRMAIIDQKLKTIVELMEIARANA